MTGWELFPNIIGLDGVHAAVPAQLSKLLKLPAPEPSRDLRKARRVVQHINEEQVKQLKDDVAQVEEEEAAEDARALTPSPADEEAQLDTSTPTVAPHEETAEDKPDNEKPAGGHGSSCVDAGRRGLP